VLKKHLTRFWPVWAAYLLIWVFVLPFPLLRTQTADMLSAGSGLAPALAAEIVRANMADHILQVSGAITVLYTLFYGAVVAVAVFHFMHSARAVSLYHALPVKREGLFLSSLAAGVIYSVGPHAVIALLTMLVGALRGVSLAAEALTWFYAACMMSLLWLSIGALAAVCSGNPIVQTVLYFIFNFVVVLVELVARYLGSMVLFGVGWSSPTLRFLSPAVLFITGGPGLPEGLVDYRYDVMTDSASYVFQGWSALAWYLLAAAVIAVCALLIYRRRRSESAGDVISVRCLKPVFKYCLTFGLALGLGTMLWWMFNRSGNAYLTTGDVVSLALWMLFAAAIGYLAGEMLVKKTLRIWKPKMFLGLIVSLVIVAAGVFLLRADVLGIEKRLPAAADVESVFINGSMTRAWDSAASDPETIQEVLDLNRLILDNKEVIRRDANNFGYEEAHTAEGVWYDSQRTAYFRFNYLLKNGSTVVRTYTVPVTVGDIRDTNTVAGRYLAIANDLDQLLRQATLPEGGELHGPCITPFWRTPPRGQ